MWQARYTAPDGQRHRAPITFTTKGDASAWLALKRSEVLRGVWLPEQNTSGAMTLESYAANWLAGRDLTARTRSEYRGLLDRHILPELGQLTLGDISPNLVRSWHSALPTGPTSRAHAYALLRTIMATATADDMIAANPCRVRGAGTSKRVKQIRPASLGELEVIVAQMPEKLRLMVLLASWTALRFGELTELRRSDIDTKGGKLRIRRGVTHVTGKGYVIGHPKSDAGSRDVALPPHLVSVVKAHLLEHTQPGKDGLLFPAAGGGHLAPATLYRSWYAARATAGRSDLRFHDLRHTGAVWRLRPVPRLPS